MGRLQPAIHLLFLASPVVGGVAGYRYFGWIGAIVCSIAALPLVPIILIASLLFTLWLKYLSDRNRVSHLSIAELQNIVATPQNTDFQFAFRRLAAGGANVQQIQQLLLAMLTSDDRPERSLGLARLQEIYPSLRNNFDPFLKDSPQSLQRWIYEFLKNNGELHCSAAPSSLGDSKPPT